MSRVRANIGIYNLHMSSKGGREKLTLALAEHLSREHNIWLCQAEPLDLAALERYFGVDLSRVKIMTLKSLGPPLIVSAAVRGRSHKIFLAPKKCLVGSPSSRDVW